MCGVIMTIIDKEWVMFVSVNGENRVSCQEDREMFTRMRKAQFDAWPEKAVTCYLQDLVDAESTGRNLVREKYIHMMKSTDICGYNHLIGELPEISQRKNEIIDDIWIIMEKQTDKIRKKYPLVALGGRPFHAYEEYNGATSVETYQRGELLTYSEKTLEALKEGLVDMELKGVDMVRVIQENSVVCQGYASMEDAEAAMDKVIRKKILAGNCCCGE